MLITTLNRGFGRNLTRRSINQNILEHRRFASKSDLIVVLDMDECLIHSQFLSMKDDLYRQKEARPDKISTKTIESFRITLPDGDIVQVNKRPHLDEFLQKVSSRFETHIFTAAMEVYARPVLDKLDPHGTIFSKRFYRNFCTQNTELGCYVKDLEEIRNHEEKTSPLLLSKVSDFRRMVLVDNNPLSFLMQPSNGILVSNFYDNPEDKTLTGVLDLLDRLDEEDDVRPLLDDMFGLSAALAELQGKKRI